MRVEPWIVIVVIVAVGVLFYLAQHFGWIDLSDKSRNSGTHGTMGIGDEVFNPSRYEAQVELDRQTVLPAPAPLPGDGDFGLNALKGNDPKSTNLTSYGGQVKIDLTPASDPKHRKSPSG
jgi:hypothetical protein